MGDPRLTARPQEGGAPAAADGGGRGPGRTPGGRGGGLAPSGLGLGGFALRGPDTGPARADTDKVMDDLRDLLDQHGTAEPAQGETGVRWAYEVMAPAAAGAVLLAILLATG